MQQKEGRRFLPGLNAGVSTPKKKMIKQILENARPAMHLSLALLFLVSTGWVVRLYWIQEPIQALGQRLLAKDGALLIKILSDDKTIGALRRLTAPSGKTPPAPGPLHHLIDQLVAKEGALLKGLSAALLKQPTLQKLLLARPAGDRSSGTSPPLVILGRYALDRLLAQDAKLASQLVSQMIAALASQPPAGSQKAGAVPDSWATIERLGQFAIGRLLEKQGALALHVTQRLIASQSQAHSSPQAKPWDLNAVVKSLGEYAILQLTASRAQALRAILQSLLGPEPMRAMQGLRQIIHRLSHQLGGLHVGQLVREAAYQLGRGGLEAFLREQEATRQKSARQERKVQQRRARMRQELRRLTPCFVPRGAQWMAYQKGAIRVQMHVLQQLPQCKQSQCQAQRDIAQQHLWSRFKDMLSTPVDLVLSLTPGCHPAATRQQAGHKTPSQEHRVTPPVTKRSTTRSAPRNRPRAAPKPPKSKQRVTPKARPAPNKARRQIPPKR